MKELRKEIKIYVFSLGLCLSILVVFRMIEKLLGMTDGLIPLLVGFLLFATVSPWIRKAIEE